MSLAAAHSSSWVNATPSPSAVHNPEARTSSSAPRASSTPRTARVRCRTCSLEPAPERRPGLEGLARRCSTPGRCGRRALPAGPGEPRGPQEARRRPARRAGPLPPGTRRAVRRRAGCPRCAGAASRRATAGGSGRAGTARAASMCSHVERPDGEHECFGSRVPGMAAAGSSSWHVEMTVDRGAGERVEHPRRAGPARSGRATGRRRGPGPEGRRRSGRSGAR